MPELPEVETIRRQLEPRLVGRLIVEAGSHPSAKFSPARETTGSRVSSVDRRGKYLIAGLDNGGHCTDRELVIHLGMTGLLRVVSDGEPGDDPYVRAWFSLDDGERLEYRDIRRFGRLRVVPAGDYTSIETLRAIGPEPLDDEFTPDGFFGALRRSDRRVKTQLLSQRPVAGIGNIYADEALWLAGVNPALRRVTRSQAGDLHDAIRTVISQGIDNRGTTLRDYRSFDGTPGDNQRWLHCYGRAGLPCDRCGTELVSRVLDARTTTFCPECQRR